MSRREFSKKTKREALKRADGRCEGKRCGVVLTFGKFAYDHVDPDSLTGEPTLENCQVLCSPCHLEKTRQDVDIARAKRRQDLHQGITRPATLKGQGFRKFAPPRRATTPVEKLQIAYRRPTA